MSDENKNVETSVEGVSDLEANTASNNSEPAEEKESGERMFSQSEVNQMIEKRLIKEKKKQEKALQEAERLSKMSEEERVKAAFEAERQAFEEERAAYLAEKMHVQCEKELITNGLPPEFAKLLTTDNADTTKENIELFKEKWNKALEKAVNEKLKSNARVPKKETESTGKITWEDVLKDSSLLKKYREQNKK